jgi:hypothetical protein
VHPCRNHTPPYSIVLASYQTQNCSLISCGFRSLSTDARSSLALPTIILLANNSGFEIHSKRFTVNFLTHQNKFAPPFSLRLLVSLRLLFARQLLKYSSGPRNHALRLSMIHSAQVFSSHPSKDPRENLRILQSPLMNSFKSPVKATLQEEDEIILVQGSQPRVVQEEHDLVILEDVVLPPTSSSNPHANIEPPRTPQRRRSLGGNTRSPQGRERKNWRFRVPL